MVWFTIDGVVEDEQDLFSEATPERVTLSDFLTKYNMVCLKDANGFTSEIFLDENLPRFLHEMRVSKPEELIGREAIVYFSNDSKEAYAICAPQ